MHFVYLPGKQNVLADGLSRRPDYMSAGQPVLLSLDKENTAVPVDDLVADCFETLSRGRPVADVHCSACKHALPHDVLSLPGRAPCERSVTCPACGARTLVSAFNSPLGRYSPVIRTIDGASGLFLMVKGEPPPGRVAPQVPADEGPSLAALGISAPVMDLAAELRPLQMANEKLKPLR